MPYTKDGELYVVHNGVINKYKAYKVLRSDYEVELRINKVSDTYVLARLTASLYKESSDVETMIKKLAAFLRDTNGIESALNTGILLIRQCCTDLLRPIMGRSPLQVR